MEEYLRRLASLLPAPLRGVAGPVVDRLIAVWQWPRSLAVRVRGGWQRVRTGARRLNEGIDRLSSETFGTLRWLAATRLPALARWARDQSIAWARDRLTELRANIDTVRAFAVVVAARLRAEALGLLAGLRSWVVDLTARALSGVGQLLKRVFDTWATPERLAAWLAGAMWSALWGYAASNAERLAAWFWARRKRVTMAAIDEIESIVRHVL